MNTTSRLSSPDLAESLVRPWLVRHSTTEKLQDGPNSVIELLADGEHTGGAVTIDRALLEVSSRGAPPHLHRRATETIFVIGGALDVLVDETIEELGPGDMVVLPPGVAHAFAPMAGSSADMIAIYSPGQHRFDYYRLLQRLYRGEAALEELAATSNQYDNHYVASSVWEQRHPLNP